MRSLRVALVLSFVGGLGLWAAPAHAGPVSPLLEGFFDVSDEPNSAYLNGCFVGSDTGSDAGFFDVGGQVGGVGTGGQSITISYDAPQPTSASRSTAKIAVKQSQFATLRVVGGAPGAFDTGTLTVAKCKVNGSVNGTKLTGSVSASCGGNDAFAPLTADQGASVVAAFAGSKHIKVKIDASTGKWSLSIKCKGAAIPETTM